MMISCAFSFLCKIWSCLDICKCHFLFEILQLSETRAELGPKKINQGIAQATKMVQPYAQA